MMRSLHAEAAADASGVLDYSSLPSRSVSGMEFHIRENCIEPSDGLISIHHDFRYLSENGYDPRPAMYMTQFMRNTEDLKSEYIVTYAKRVMACSEDAITESFKNRVQLEVEQLVVLSEE